MIELWYFSRAILFLLIVFFLVACTTVSSQPKVAGIKTSDYKSRIQIHSDRNVTVSSSVLSNDESLAVYGVPLADKDIQPVWIEVENNDDVAYWLMSPGLDPNFFPASEVVDAFTDIAAVDTYSQREKLFTDLAFRNPVPPGSKVSGFVLTNLDQGVKMVQLDLVASGRLRTFSFMSTVPGFSADYKAKKVFTQQLYAEDELIHYADDDDLRRALEALPCCVTNQTGTRNGDPLNLVVIGGLDDAFPALVRRGWRPTEVTWSGSVMKMITSTLAGERYPYAPVSPLFVYGRSQDLALQKARDNIHQRNHLRLWLSPMRYQGKAVWIGQISRDIGSRLTIHSPYLTTHKIDPDVDEALNALLEDMAYSQNLQKIGLVKGVGAVSRSAPRQNLTTDPYYTHGFRGVMFFDSKPTSMIDIEFLDWEGKEGGLVKASAKEKR